MRRWSYVCKVATQALKYTKLDVASRGAATAYADEHQLI
jgi:hypothetical protein